MEHARKIGIPVVVIALLVNDAVTVIKLTHTLSWVLGSLGWLAAVSMLLLANAVTVAFFFDGLEPKHIRRLHAIAIYLYVLIALAVYAAGVEIGQQHFPATLAHHAFHLSQARAVTVWSLGVGAGLALTTLTFWGVLGALIRAHVARGHAVPWEQPAAERGLETDNILDYGKRRSS